MINDVKLVKRNLRKDRIFVGIISVFSLLCVVPLIVILYFIFVNGASSINWNLFTHDGGIGEEGAGILHAIIGTTEITLLASLIAIPVGILAGVWMAENTRGKFSGFARIVVDVMQGVPSVVLGMVVSIWIVKPFQSFSAFSGSVALAIMMLPVVIKNTEETLKLVPGSIKEAAYALGLPYHRIILKIVLPCGLSGILTGVLVAVARIAGETAPLIFTAFGANYVNLNIFKPMETIPGIIYKSYTFYGEGASVAWGASFVLVIFVLTINLIAKVVINRWKVKF
jgi:phosphate transport system permease protein